MRESTFPNQCFQPSGGRPCTHQNLVLTLKTSRDSHALGLTSAHLRRHSGGFRVSWCIPRKPHRLGLQIPPLASRHNRKAKRSGLSAFRSCTSITGECVGDESGRWWDCWPSFDNEDPDFLYGFFANIWEMLRKQHPAHPRNLLEDLTFISENSLRTEGRPRKAHHQLLMDYRDLWSDQEKNCSTKRMPISEYSTVLTCSRGRSSGHRKMAAFVGKSRHGFFSTIHRIREHWNPAKTDPHRHERATTWQQNHRVQGRTTTSRHSSAASLPSPKFDEWGVNISQRPSGRFHTMSIPDTHREYRHHRAWNHHRGRAYIHDGVRIGSQSHVGVGTHIRSDKHRGRAELLMGTWIALPVVIEDGAITEAGPPAPDS